MNLLLRCDGYPPALIVGSDRQRYYPVLVFGGRFAGGTDCGFLDSYCVSANQFLNPFASLRSYPASSSNFGITGIAICGGVARPDRFPR